MERTNRRSVIISTGSRTQGVGIWPAPEVSPVFISKFRKSSSTWCLCHICGIPFPLLPTVVSCSICFAGCVSVVLSRYPNFLRRRIFIDLTISGCFNIYILRNCITVSNVRSHIHSTLLSNYISFLWCSLIRCLMTGNWLVRNKPE